MGIDYCSTLFYGIKLEEDQDEVLDVIQQHQYMPYSPETWEEADPLEETYYFLGGANTPVQIEQKSYLGDVHESYLAVSKSVYGDGPIDMPKVEDFEPILREWVDKLKLKTVGEPSWFLVPSVY